MSASDLYKIKKKLVAGYNFWNLSGKIVIFISEIMGEEICINNFRDALYYKANLCHIQLSMTNIILIMYQNHVISLHTLYTVSLCLVSRCVHLIRTLLDKLSCAECWRSFDDCDVTGRTVLLKNINFFKQSN